MDQKPVNNSYLPPIVFHPILKPVIWGGSFMKYFKSLDTYSGGGTIGECWEISGLEGDESIVEGGEYDGLSISELIARLGARLMGKRVYEKFGTRFPILVKFIDAARDLSVQVHPDDATAKDSGLIGGKNELWYIIRSQGGAKIYAGFKKALTPEEYERAIESKTILDFISTHNSRSGDTFYLPGGNIHAIGAGNFLMEIQQTSGITYRVYDYDRKDKSGRKRQLHTEEARRVMSLEKYDSFIPSPYWRHSNDQILLMKDWATVRKHHVDGTCSLEFPLDSFTILTCIEGSVTINYPGTHFELSFGHTCLLAAEIKDVMVDGSGIVISSAVSM